jgi:hypothetical protein
LAIYTPLINLAKSDCKGVSVFIFKAGLFLANLSMAMC